MARIFARLGSLIFILLLLPVIVIIISILYLLYFFTAQSSGPFLYKAQRLGQWKKPFIMCKIRTLTDNFDKNFSSLSYCEHSKHALWYGSFLRTTKLDELPQIINIIKGEMAFIGPRPVRVYDYVKSYAHIQNSEIRFSVKPGLTGMSQLFTSAGAPRKLRVILENRFLNKKYDFSFKVIILFRTIVNIILKGLIEIQKHIVKRINCMHLVETKECRRAYDRVKIDCNKIIANAINEADVLELFPVNVNYTHIMIETAANMQIGTEFCMHVECRHRKKGKVRKHLIRCQAIVEKVNPSGNKGNVYVCQYIPANEYNRYLIDKYVLKRVLQL